MRRRWPVGLAVGAIFRDEAPYLAEWIEFHRRQGVERFYLYENNSSDDWGAALEPYRDIVELHRWPDHPGQFTAYADCLRRHRWDTRWIAFIDLDEFLFSPTGESLPAVLARFPRVAAVVANWRCYGTSGHETPPNGPVVKSYTRRAIDDHPINRHVKSIVFPLLTMTVIRQVHHFNHYARTVGERGDVVTSAFRTPPTADLLRINHYRTKSLSEYRLRQARPRVDTDAQARDASDLAALNAVFDPYY